MDWKSLNLARVSIIIVHFMAILFVLSVLIAGIGIGLITESRCHSAIKLCLVFYLGKTPV